MIHRTTARCGAEYEWGVHVAAFAGPLGLSEDWIRATVLADADDPVWTPRQAALVRLVDALALPNEAAAERFPGRRESNDS